ncbi:MAG: hypothetical protein Q8O56_14000 [Solirubrobacteraceae bacterium]|nr:hypothetical protein [Solirubrobacteraceae bacterium]
MLIDDLVAAAQARCGALVLRREAGMVVAEIVCEVGAVQGRAWTPSDALQALRDELERPASGLVTTRGGDRPPLRLVEDSHV